MSSSKYSIESSAGGGLKLAGAMDTYAAAELRERLARALGEHPSVTVDLAGVESCDFSAIQLLVAARQSALVAGKRFTVSPAPESVKAVCAALGLAPAAICGPESE